MQAAPRNRARIAVSYNYDAFGNEKNPDADDANPFRYCGEYYDTETGLYYLRARYYDPTVGRFTQADTHWNTANMIYGDNPQKINERQDALGLKTYSYAPQISAVMQSGNLYVYCVNNPLLYFDPTGDLLNAIIGGIVGGIVGGISSLASGGSFWTGAAEGAVSGAIAGLAVDAAIAVVATGGVAMVITAGLIATAGGFVGSIAGQQVNSLISFGKLGKIDWGEAALDGAINLLAFGTSGLLKYADEGIAGFNRSSKLADILNAAFGDALSTNWMDAVSFDAAIKISTIRTLIAAARYGRDSIGA